MEGYEVALTILGIHEQLNKMHMLLPTLNGYERDVRVILEMAMSKFDALVIDIAEIENSAE